MVGASLYNVSVHLSCHSLSKLEAEPNFHLYLSDSDEGLGKLTFNCFEQPETFERKLAISNPGVDKYKQKRPAALPTRSPIKPKARSVMPASPVQATESSSFLQNPNDFVGASQDLVTGDKTFSCKFCGFSTANKANVVRHVNLKHINGGTVFNCNLCEYSTKLKADMKKHYIKKHQLPEAMANAAVS